MHLLIFQLIIKKKKILKKLQSHFLFQLTQLAVIM